MYVRFPCIQKSILKNEMFFLSHQFRTQATVFNHYIFVIKEFCFRHKQSKAHLWGKHGVYLSFSGLLTRRRKVCVSSCDRPHRQSFSCFPPPSSKCWDGLQVLSCWCMVRMQLSRFNLPQLNPKWINRSSLEYPGMRALVRPFPARNWCTSLSTLHVSRFSLIALFVYSLHGAFYCKELDRILPIPFDILLMNSTDYQIMFSLPVDIVGLSHLIQKLLTFPQLIFHDCALNWQFSVD
jgi:hypothetical protein